MNIKEYIESGILEAYVLGALPENERATVEADIIMYPELAAEVAAIEKAMQHFAEEGAIEPPAHLQDQVWNAIQASAEPVKQEVKQETAKPKAVEFRPQAEAPKTAWQRAAVWAALLVSVLTNFILLSQRNKGTEQVKALAAKIDSMNADHQHMLAMADAYTKERIMLADTGMKTVVMRSAKPGHEMTGMVFWSKTKGDTYVSIHNMPMPEQGKQYQLWVIQDGKPVSMGTIDNNLVANAGMMYKVPMLVSGGQAFAISLEKEGGNPAPTDVMVVGTI